jgi:hypothetical protein
VCGIGKILDKNALFDIFAEILSPVAQWQLKSGSQHLLMPGSTCSG